MEKEMYTESEIRWGGGEIECMESVSMSVCGSVCVCLFETAIYKKQEERK